MKKRVRADDLVKTPVSQDMGAPCCCNPPALLLSSEGSSWPAIGKGNGPKVYFKCRVSRSMRHDPYISTRSVICSQCKDTLISSIYQTF